MFALLCFKEKISQSLTVLKLKFCVGSVEREREREREDEGTGEGQGQFEGQGHAL